MSVKGVTTEGAIKPPVAKGCTGRVALVALGAIALGLGVLGVLPSHIPLQALARHVTSISIPLVAVGGTLIVQSVLDDDWNMAKTTLAALSIAVGVLGIVNPNGLSQYAVQHLTKNYVAIPLMVTGGSLLIYSAADFVVSRRGSRNFKQASLARKLDYYAHVPMHALRSYWVRNEKIGNGAIAPGPSWYHRRHISGPQVVDYAKTLQKKAHDFQYFYAMEDNAGLPEAEHNCIIMDFVLEGAADHIVTVKIDRAAHTIDYYDSMGLTINDRAGTTVRHMGISVEALIEQIAEKYIIVKKYKPIQPFVIRENTRRDQFDVHSCGVMVSLRKCSWLANTPEEKRVADSRNEMEYRGHMMDLMEMPRGGEVAYEGDDNFDLDEE